MPLYDFIYVDLDKVISIYSQMTGGVVEVLERSSEHSQSSDNKRNYDFKVFKHDAGGTANDKSISKEIVKPHHALLKEMEEALAANGYLVDLTDPDVAKSFRDPKFRAQLKDTFCVKVRGRAVIEDYEHMKSIAAAFPDYPSLDRPDEHVFGHLKKLCFEDVDASSFHFTYGSFPTETLTMIGIVTSVPAEGGETFKPLVEFERDGLANYESVENAFRGLFRGFDGLEQMIRTSRFPRVLVQPLTVYPINGG